MYHTFSSNPSNRFQIIAFRKIKNCFNYYLVIKFEKNTKTDDKQTAETEDNTKIPNEDGSG